MKKYLTTFAILAWITLLLAGCQREKPFAIDLDTTYFPFGADYEWYYEGYTENYRDGQLLSADTQTYYVLVLDSSGTDTSWTFKLEGYFDDLSTTVEIEKDSVYVYMEGHGGTIGKTINVSDPQTDTLPPDLYNVFSIEYAGDTLQIKLKYSISANNAVYHTVSRVKGLGTTYQSISSRAGTDSIFTLDKTLFLRKGTDTIWF